MKCKHCGEEIANDSKFCEFCGKEVKRKKKWPWIVVGIIVVVIALLINHLLCEHYRKQEMIVEILNRLNEQEQIINSCGDIVVVANANGTPTDDFEQIRKKLSNCEEVEVEKRNIMVVMVNSDNNILVNGEPINIDELNTRVKDFLGNPSNLDYFSDKELKTIPGLGEYFVSKGLISLQRFGNVESSSFYDHVEFELENAIYEMRDELSKNKFNTPFSLLEDETQSMAIRDAIPLAIVKKDDNETPRSSYKKQSVGNLNTEDKDYILNKAREAGQAKCNCYKTDPAVVEQCFKTIMDQNYAAYNDDADFHAELKAEYNRCIKAR